MNTITENSIRKMRRSVIEALDTHSSVVYSHLDYRQDRLLNESQAALVEINLNLLEILGEYKRPLPERHG